MNREADYTIKGFLYQFNVTLLNILDSIEQEEVTIEGVIEDVDITNVDYVTAIQCKYHEAQNFTLSIISKPLLQMICHFIQNNHPSNNYILYSYFSNLEHGKFPIGYDDIKSILSTQNMELIKKYISVIKPPNNYEIKKLLTKNKLTEDEKEKVKKYYRESDLEEQFDINDFIENRFTLIVGESYQNLSKKIKQKLNDEGFSEKDVEELFYPNAIQRVSELSTIHNPENRKTNKSQFLDFLHKTKKTAITRWTKELMTQKQLLKLRKMQIKTNLNTNSRKRYFIIEPTCLDDFDNNIVSFIKEYLDNYHYKIKLHKETPIFLLKCEEKYIEELEERLHTRDIKIVTGLINNNFYSSQFLKEPKKIIKESWREFDLRLGVLNSNTIESINFSKCDDLFIIDKNDKEQCTSIDFKDINVEPLEINKFIELRYLLNLVKEI
ncbi:hypothetical protein [Salibacterium sp. K-3]